MSSPKILEFIEGFRMQKGVSRKDLADLMGEPWTKEKIDKVLTSASCPRPETLAEIMKALGIPTFPPSWFRSKRGED